MPDVLQGSEKTIGGGVAEGRHRIVQELTSMFRRLHRVSGTASLAWDIADHPSTGAGQHLHAGQSSGSRMWIGVTEKTRAANSRIASSRSKVALKSSASSCLSTAIKATEYGRLNLT